MQLWLYTIQKRLLQTGIMEVDWVHTFTERCCYLWKRERGTFFSCDMKTVSPPAQQQDRLDHKVFIMHGTWFATICSMYDHNIFIHGLEEPYDWCMESYLSHTLIFMYVSLYVCLYVFIHAILTNYDVYVWFVTLFCRGCCTIVAAEFLLGSVWGFSCSAYNAFCGLQGIYCWQGFEKFVM
jgi:hypothetical protein